MKTLLYTCLALLLLSACGRSIMEAGKVMPRDFKPVEIPFELQRGLITFEASVNGVRGKFAMDNGFSLNGLDFAFAEKAGITAGKGTTARDGNNNMVALKRTYIDRLAIGDVTVEKTGVLLLDFRAFLPCDSLDGIVGANVINKANWKIDFEREVIYVASEPFDEPGIRMDYRETGGNIHIIDMEVNDVAAPVKVDFGFNGELKMESKRYQQYFEGYRGYRFRGITSRSVSGLGNVDTVYYIFDSLQLSYGGRALPTPPVVSLTKNVSNTRLGLEYFQHYRTIVNGSDKQYILQPLDSIAPYRPGAGYGMRISQVDGVYRVTAVAADRMWERGLRIDDEVVALNDRQLSEVPDQCDFQDLMTELYEREEPIQVYIRGRSEPILADYVLPSSVLIPSLGE